MIVVIATLATLVAPNVFKHVGAAKDATARSQIEMLASALDAYRLDNCRYPTAAQGLNALWEAPSGDRKPANWRGPYVQKPSRTTPGIVVNTATRAVAQRINYDEFGQVIQNTNPGFQPFAFGGGHLDDHSTLLRFGATDFDPALGRWVSKDPIGFSSGDENLYAYVRNDPTSTTDPSGMQGNPYAECDAEYFECTINVGGSASLRGIARPRALHRGIREVSSKC